MMNICMALFHIFGANYIYSSNYKYIWGIRQIPMPFFIHMYTVTVPAIKLGQR